MKQVYELDPNHSSLGFAGKHMMVTTVRGKFKDFDGDVEVENDDPTTAVARVTIRPASVDTGQEQRDAHLRSADFFHAERFPEMTFVSTGVESQGGRRYRVTGDLTIKDRTRPITLDVEVEERLDQGSVAEGEGVVAEEIPGPRIDLLGKHAEVPAVAQRLGEEVLRTCRLAGTGECLHVPEGRGQEGAFAV